MSARNTFPVPKSEEERLAALERYRILDTLPEQVFDDITFLAAHLCGTPVALVSLVDAERQWFKSRVGWKRAETPRGLAFCAHAILQQELMIVPDTRHDPRFRDHPLVVGPPHVRFYAGAPLITPDGFAIGTLCVIDRVPRVLSGEQQLALTALARMVVAQLELRLRLKGMEENLAEADAVR
jgi:two-component system, NtrC family, sensor kinase